MARAAPAHSHCFEIAACRPPLIRGKSARPSDKRGTGLITRRFTSVATLFLFQSPFVAECTYAYVDQCFNPHPLRDELGSLVASHTHYTPFRSNVRATYTDFPKRRQLMLVHVCSCNFTSFRVALSSIDLRSIARR